MYIKDDNWDIVPTQTLHDHTKKSVTQKISELPQLIFISEHKSFQCIKVDLIQDTNKIGKSQYSVVENLIDSYLFNYWFNF